MDSIIFEVSRKGNGVIIGHGSQMLLQDFGCALHVRIQAALLKDNLDDNLLTVDVSETGVIELGGLTHSQELLDRIIEVVHKIPGVSKVRSEIVVAASLYAGSLNRTRS